MSHVTNSDPTQTSDFTWDLAEKHWDTFEEVTRPEQLQVGCSVSWKELAINPQTFTPEFLLSVARIVHLPDPVTGQHLVVRPFTRPAVSEGHALALGFIQEGRSDDQEYNWSDVIASKWKIVHLKELS